MKFLVHHFLACPLPCNQTWSVKTIQQSMRCWKHAIKHELLKACNQAWGVKKHTTKYKVLKNMQPSMRCHNAWIKRHVVKCMQPKEHLIAFITWHLTGQGDSWTYFTYLSSYKDETCRYISSPWNKKNNIFFSLSRHLGKPCNKSPINSLALGSHSSLGVLTY